MLKSKMLFGALVAAGLAFNIPGGSRKGRRASRRLAVSINLEVALENEVQC
jgi:hypothetical protein